VTFIRGENLPTSGHLIPNLESDPSTGAHIESLEILLAASEDLKQMIR
jgi:hypothetical protein